ncbi:MAG: ABC transporter ATP-binding protein [Chloroflexi bacterium]|nr:ABC transporter ATP-binding protein [Chloroflexota bacterium]
MLKVENLSAAYGQVQVLWDVSLEVHQGEIVALIGSNGAGKSTLLSTISGLMKPRAGALTFDGRDITGAPTDQIARSGIAHVPQGRHLFAGLTVKENLLMGAYTRRDGPHVQKDLAWVLDLFPSLQRRLAMPAGRLSGGEQQMCAVGRGLMARPKLLMIDEFSLGLAPIVVEQLVETIQTINQEGLTLLIVEQDVQVALEHAHRGYVLETGHIVLSGDAQSLLDNEHVRGAYLGV